MPIKSLFTCHVLSFWIDKTFHMPVQLSTNKLLPCLVKLLWKDKTLPCVVMLAASKQVPKTFMLSIVGSFRLQFHFCYGQGFLVKLQVEIIKTLYLKVNSNDQKVHGGCNNVKQQNTKAKFLHYPIIKMKSTWVIFDTSTLYAWRSKGHNIWHFQSKKKKSLNV